MDIKNHNTDRKKPVMRKRLRIAVFIVAFVGIVLLVFQYFRFVSKTVYEATKQIRALDDPALAGITILAMTANAFDEDRKKAMEWGMDGFLSKPIVIEELISALHENLLD